MDFAVRLMEIRNFRNCSGEIVRDCTEELQDAGFDAFGETSCFNSHSE